MKTPHQWLGKLSGNLDATGFEIHLSESDIAAIQADALESAAKYCVQDGNPMVAKQNFLALKLSLTPCSSAISMNTHLAPQLLAAQHDMPQMQSSKPDRPGITRHPQRHRDPKKTKM